jgi:hypothetical protein
MSILLPQATYVCGNTVKWVAFFFFTPRADFDILFTSVSINVRPIILAAELDN